MIVVDASVINKLFLKEPGTDTVKAIIRRHLTQKEEVIVPVLLFYEISNTLATKAEILPPKLDQSIEELFKLNLQVVYPSEQEIIRSAKFSREYKVSVYDASYAVLAKDKKCALVTADEKFVKDISLSFVKSLSQYQPA